MTLGILIPTLVKRRSMLRRLMDRLEPQLSSRIKVYTSEDTGQQTTGRKRQKLLEESDTDYVAHIDDDDLVSETYCKDMLDAIEQGCDVVGFKLRYFEEGNLAGYSIHSLKHDRWGQIRGEDGLMHYHRTPNHLNPTRREIALQVGFVDKSIGEDAAYSEKLYAKFGQSMKEVFVDAFEYDYYFAAKVLARPVMYTNEGILRREAMERIIQDGGSILINGRLCTSIAQLDG